MVPLSLHAPCDSGIDLGLEEAEVFVENAEGDDCEAGEDKAGGGGDVPLGEDDAGILDLGVPAMISE